MKERTDSVQSFLTIFLLSGVKNAHLYKDFGMIPYGLAKFHQWNTGVAYINSDEILTDKLFSQYVDFLPIHFSKNPLIMWKNLIRFILKNAKKYDVINFYHGGKKIYICAAIFKLFNPDCKIYIKLDMNEEMFHKHLNVETSKIKIFKNKIKTLFLKYLIDLYTVESKSFFYELNKLKIFQDKIKYLPNGFNTDFNYEGLVNTSKEKIILTVGRIGTYEKNNEMLIQAILNIKKEKVSNWKIYFVGPVEKNFIQYVELQYKEHPFLKNLICFTGNIANKNELYQIYAKSKIFCLTSRWEGSALVIPEAMFFKNYVITTDYPSVHDMIVNDSYGKIVNSNSIQEYSKAIEAVMDEMVDTVIISETAHKQIRENFNWQDLCKILSDELKVLF